MSGKMIYVIKTGPEVVGNCLERVLLIFQKSSLFSFDFLSKSKVSCEGAPERHPLIYYSVSRINL